MSNPQGSLLIKTNLSALKAMAFKHFLHGDHLDLAYSAIIFTRASDDNDDIVADAMNKFK